MKSVRGLSVMWGDNDVREEWPFFVKALGFSRKDAMAHMLSLVPGRYSVGDACRKVVRYLS